MYVPRVRRSSDESDVRTPMDRKERLDRSMSAEVASTRPLSYYFQQPEKISEEDNSSDTIDGRPKRKTFDPDELPDGFCISPQRSVQTHQDTPESAVRTAEYIGSFSVVGDDQKSRADYVRKQLSEMREVTKTKQVLLVISLSGVKVCSSSGESVYMAHALKRISYATCDPEYCQFSFLAREPKGQTTIQYCHAFITQTPEQAEELNSIVGNAFQMAYAYQRQVSSAQETSQQPSFNDMIAKQIEDQRAQYDQYAEQKQKQLQAKLHQISTATVAERVKERRERRKEHEQKEQEEKQARLGSKDKMSWAKQIVGRTRHKLPFADDNQWQQQQHQSVIGSSHGSSSSRPSSTIMSQRASIVSIKEEFETREFHGSPVMALKETIDNHFNTNGTTSSFAHFSANTINSHVTNHVTSVHVHDEGDAPDGMDSHLSPASPSANHEADEKPSPRESPTVSMDHRNGICAPSDHSSHSSPSPQQEVRNSRHGSPSPQQERSPDMGDISNRPLPATPTEEKRSRKKKKVPTATLR